MATYTCRHWHAPGIAADALRCPACGGSDPIGGNFFGWLERTADRVIQGRWGELAFILMLLGLPFGLLLFFIRGFHRGSPLELGHLQAYSLMAGLAVVPIVALGLVVVGMLAAAGAFR
jgi:hypothetical protein